MIMPYGDLRKITKGLDLHTHHLVEKRFAGNLGLNSDDILSIAIDKNTHQQITNLMSDKIPYNTLSDKSTSNATPQQIWSATRDVYKQLGLTEYLTPLKQQFEAAGHNLSWGSW